MLGGVFDGLYSHMECLFSVINAHTIELLKFKTVYDAPSEKGYNFILFANRQAM